MFSPFGFMATQASGFIGLLDTYTGAEVAYSLRKLSSSSTYAVTVRRSSDNATQDIGFVGEAFDTASLSSFISSDSAYVTKWYDQSGNSNHLVQATTTSQPRIANAGTIDVVNGLPTLYFDGSNDYFDVTSNIPTAASSFWAYVLDRTSATLQPTLAAGTGVPYGAYWYSDTNIYYAPNNAAGNGRPASSTGQSLVILDAPSSPSALYVNGNNITSGNGTFSYQASNYIYFGRRASDYFQNECQEFILWNSNQSSNLSGIDSNINTYYSIYP